MIVIDFVIIIVMFYHLTVSPVALAVPFRKRVSSKSLQASEEVHCTFLARELQLVNDLIHTLEATMGS